MTSSKCAIRGIATETNTQANQQLYSDFNLRSIRIDLPLRTPFKLNANTSHLQVGIHPQVLLSAVQKHASKKHQILGLKPKKKTVVHEKIGFSLLEKDFKVSEQQVSKKMYLLNVLILSLNSFFIVESYIVERLDPSGCLFCGHGCMLSPLLNLIVLD